MDSIIAKAAKKTRIPALESSSKNETGAARFERLFPTNLLKIECRELSAWHRSSWAIAWRKLAWRWEKLDSKSTTCWKDSFNWVVHNSANRHQVCELSWLEYCSVYLDISKHCISLSSRLEPRTSRHTREPNEPVNANRSTALRPTGKCRINDVSFHSRIRSRLLLKLLRFPSSSMWP